MVYWYGIGVPLVYHHTIPVVWYSGTPGKVQWYTGIPIPYQWYTNGIPIYHTTGIPIPCLTIPYHTVPPPEKPAPDLKMSIFNGLISRLYQADTNNDTKKMANC